MEDMASPLDPADILLDVDAADSGALFATVEQALQGHYGSEASGMAAALAAREALGSTGIGMGVAIPHARISGLQKTRAAFVRLRQPIEFDAPDAEKVSLFFLLLVPGSASERHLDFLAQFATLAVDAKLREELRSAEDAQRICELIASNTQQPMLKAA